MHFPLKVVTHFNFQILNYAFSTRCPISRKSQKKTTHYTLVSRYVALKCFLPLSSIEADVWCNVVWVKAVSLNGDNWDDVGGGNSVSENSSQSSDISTTWLASELS